MLQPVLVCSAQLVAVLRRGTPGNEQDPEGSRGMRTVWHRTTQITTPSVLTETEEGGLLELQVVWIPGCGCSTIEGAN
jgi:hypothetical protein